MAHHITFAESDEGKRVVNDAGEEVGIVSTVRNGTAYVDPDPDIFETIKAKLGWDDIDEDVYPLGEDAVSEITDDEVRLHRV